MIAIRVRYCPATKHRGHRLVVTDGRHRLSVPYEYGNDDCYFSFYTKADPEKLEELLSQFDGVKLTPFAADLIRTFVMQNCILK